MAYAEEVTLKINYNVKCILLLPNKVENVINISSIVLRVAHTVCG